MYAPGIGRFLTRDTWGGNANKPLSFNRWNYTYSNPINLTDPSGYVPVECQQMPNKAEYERCVDNAYKIEPINIFEMGKYVKGTVGCYTGPIEYRARGYLEGDGGWLILYRPGREVVYDYATMERESFDYGGVGINDALDSGGGLQGYVGSIFGFRTDDSIANQYRGVSGSVQIGPSADVFFGIGVGGGVFWSWTDFMLRGLVGYISGSLSGDLIEGGDIDISPLLFYEADTITRESYVIDGKVKTVRKGDLMNDILTGKGSPLSPTSLASWDANVVGLIMGVLTPTRNLAVIGAMHYADVYEELKNDPKSH